MQLPNNVMQIGAVKTAPYIYIEDYVYTYIRQILLEERDNSTRIVFLGKTEYEDGKEFIFVYGALEECPEMQKLQQEYFSRYEPVGCLTVQNMLMELQLSKGRMQLLKNFYIFFEKNESMQSFLIRQSKGPEKHVREFVRKETKVKEPAQSNFFSKLTFALGVIVCVMTVFTLRKNRMNLAENVIAPIETIFSEEITVEEISPETQVYGEVYEEPTETDEPESIVPAWNETETTEYVVQKGDTMAKILNASYGNLEKIQEVCDINQIENPDNLIPGQKILLP